MKILLVDDHALFRDGMRYVLEQLSEEVKILEAGNFSDGMRLAMQHPDLDLALLDLKMPDSEGAASIRNFHRNYPHIPVVVISSEEDHTLMNKVMSNGAMGFISKTSTASVTLGALNLVLSGGVYIPPQMLLRYEVEDEKEHDHVDRRTMYSDEHGLTKRQMQVLKYIASGLSNKEIADIIHLAEGTVKIHVAAVFQTLRVNSRLEAVRMAEKLGLIKAPYG